MTDSNRAMKNLDDAMEPVETHASDSTDNQKESEYMQFLKPHLTKQKAGAILAGVAFLGILTGILAWNVVPMGGKSSNLGLQSGTGTTRPESAEEIRAGDVFGNPDDASFRDTVEGVLLVGGSNGEGSHRIVREGGETQTVYLTSSVLDLNMFEGHAVTVKGETFRAQNAGWLMDVGQLKVVELNAELPAWVK